MKTPSWLRLGFSFAAPHYKRANAPIPARIQDLLAHMTLEEEVRQLQSNSTIPPIPGIPVGLSYMTYSYGKPVFDKARIACDGSVKVSVAVLSTWADRVRGDWVPDTSVFEVWVGG